jgi:hypothetical protein
MAAKVAVLGPLSGLNGHGAYVMRGLNFSGNLDVNSWLKMWA